MAETLGRTARYYRDNPKAKRKKYKKDKEINARPTQKKKRAESNQKRRVAKRNGHNIEGKDYDHATKRFVKSKTNRGRAGEGGRKHGPNKNKGPKKK